MNLDSKIYVAGHRGMVGSAIVRALEAKGHRNIIKRNRGDLNLVSQTDVDAFFETEKPEFVFLAAAKVGGIHANNEYPADFIYENLMIEANIIRAAFRQKVKRLLFLGSSCIYPKFAEQPMKEEALLTGTLEPTNEPYAIAKIAGIKLCESYNRQYGTDFRSIMPTNLYGPGDNFHPENSHVIPALVRRIHEAKISNSKEVKIWGTGTPKREFLHVDDLAGASLHLMTLDRAIFEKHTEPLLSHVNAGTGEDIAIIDLARLIAQVVGFEGDITTDPSKPDGTPRKLMDVSLLSDIGWKYGIGLKQGLQESYHWFLENQASFRSK